MLGHSGCGAVTGAVDAYLRPLKFWSKSTSPMLRGIIQRIFVAVREAAHGIKEVWGPNAAELPAYREALIETAVCLNAAHAAFDLRQEVERAGKWEIEVLYGVFSLHNHQVCMPANPYAPQGSDNIRLAFSPSNPREFHSLALQMAEILKPASAPPTDGKGGGNGHPAPGPAAATRAGDGEGNP
jgi:carbonic anhydrase